MNEYERTHGRQLMVLRWRPGTGPGQLDIPDFESAGLEVVASDTFWVIVRGTSAQVDSVVHGYPHWRYAGSATDGMWASHDGTTVYLYDGIVLDTHEALWESFGLAPQDFGVDDWDDVVDPELVWDCIPIY